MKVKIAREYDLQLIMDLHEKTFHEDEFDFRADSVYWVAWEGDKPLGFCAARPFAEDVLFMSWCGIRKMARGYGIQKKMIRSRLTYAKKNGYRTVLTYTSVDNICSIRNLMGSRFEVFLPEYRWAGKDFLYFRKQI